MSAASTRQVCVAATQMACVADSRENLANAEALVRDAHAAGANVILIQELFETPYFCQDQDPAFLALARPPAESPAVQLMRKLARELDVVLPASFFERAGQSHFNSMAMIDAGGELLGVYRKSHIPDGPGYQEKFYFTPGDTGFRTWQTKFGRIGVGVCWDQWFPEAARAMALAGAELLLYPTAIGSEPPDPDYDSSGHWQRTMQGHAAANLMPVVASNRVGDEVGSATTLTFYGSSFIADETGAMRATLGREDSGFATATFDLDALRARRAAWGLFRDRRPGLYASLASPLPVGG